MQAPEGPLLFLQAVGVTPELLSAAAATQPLMPSRLFEALWRRAGLEHRHRVAAAQEEADEEEGEEEEDGGGAPCNDQRTLEDFVAIAQAALGALSDLLRRATLPAAAAASSGSSWAAAPDRRPGVPPLFSPLRLRDVAPLAAALHTPRAVAEEFGCLRAAHRAAPRLIQEPPAALEAQLAALAQRERLMRDLEALVACGPLFGVDADPSADPLAATFTAAASCADTESLAAFEQLVRRAMDQRAAAEGALDLLVRTLLPRLSHTPVFSLCS